jgi:hypothetical protein
MNQITDPKLAFYFRNQQMIDEWASMASQVPALCHDFLCSLESDVRQLAKDLGTDPHISTGTDYPKLFLSKPTWNRNGARTAVGLEWVRRSVGFRNNRSTYVGVWVDLAHAEGSNLSADLQRALTNAKLLGGFSSSNWWPVRRFEGVSHDNFWENLQPYRSSLLESIKFFWNRFAATIDQTVQRA